MSKYKRFIFDHYVFNPESKVLSLHYSLDDEIKFTETFTFDFDFVANYDKEMLDVAAQTVFFMAGVSYYKTYLPDEIVVRFGSLDEESANFFSRTYQKGLGEFFYVNNLDPNSPVAFPVNTPVITIPPITEPRSGKLIGVGGGKDSLVSIELLRDEPDASTWSVGHKSQLTALVERIGLPHYWVERKWDENLLEHNKQPDSYNGHVPISAILAAVGTVAAVLAGKQDIVVSNEASANEPTLIYQDTPINHQYSKSLAFEQDFQNYLTHRFNGALRYYSLLRPFSELRIAELFADKTFDKYKDVFSSCNRAFKHDKEKISWCGECPKCAFVFLALSPFVTQNELEKLFSDKNLLKDVKLEPTYRQLLGIKGDKPLECVGEIKECRAAMRLVQSKYPELSKYEFDLPPDYDYKSLAPHSIPEDILNTLDSLK